jgi:hypothetical protein
MKLLSVSEASAAKNHHQKKSCPRKSTQTCSPVTIVQLEQTEREISKDRASSRAAEESMAQEGFGMGCTQRIWLPTFEGLGGS